MAVITDPDLLKELEEISEDRIYHVYNKIITTDYPTDPRFIDLSGRDVGYIHVDKYCGRGTPWLYERERGEVNPPEKPEGTVVAGEGEGVGTPPTMPAKNGGERWFRMGGHRRLGVPMCQGR